MYCPECSTYCHRILDRDGLPTYHCHTCDTTWQWDGEAPSGPCYRVLEQPPSPAKKGATQ